MKKAFVNPNTVAMPAGNYSHAVVVPIGDARLIFTSGQVALDASGNLVGAGDITRQTEQVFENIKAILEANNATMGDVVEANVYVTDMSERARVAEVRARYFAVNPPASTFIEVTRLAAEDWLVEINVVAVTQGK